MGNEVSAAGATGTPIPNNISVQWRAVQTNGTVPLPREGSVAFVIGTKFYVFGGGYSDPQSGPAQSNELFVLDTGKLLDIFQV